MKLAGIALLFIYSTSAAANQNKYQDPMMVSIPSGKLIKGCIQEAPCPPEERPLVSVILPKFTMSQHEITFSQWDQCYTEKACNHSPDDNGWGRGHRPVINVSWNDAQQFLTWISAKKGKNFRLPTGSEWEYAARAGTTTATPYGNCLQPSSANFDSRYGYTRFSCEYEKHYVGKTTTVGSYPKNNYGLYDTMGNVGEWTSSCATPNLLQAETATYCTKQVIRGGSWDTLPWATRSASRDNAQEKNVRNIYTGFRIVSED